MIKDVRPTIFTDFLEGHYSVSLETENTCPICHHKIEPVYLNSYSPDDSLFTVYAVLFCTHCHQPFLCHYKKLNNALTCTECFPKTFLKKEFSERVSKLSPNFVEIYNQALQAESSNLNQICGIG